MQVHVGKALPPSAHRGRTCAASCGWAATGSGTSLPHPFPASSSPPRTAPGAACAQSCSSKWQQPAAVAAAPQRLLRLWLRHRRARLPLHTLILLRRAGGTARLRPRVLWGSEASHCPATSVACRWGCGKSGVVKKGGATTFQQGCGKSGVVTRGGATTFQQGCGKRGCDHASAGL